MLFEFRCVILLKQKLLDEHSSWCQTKQKALVNVKPENLRWTPFVPSPHVQVSVCHSVISYLSHIIPFTEWVNNLGFYIPLCTYMMHSFRDKSFYILFYWMAVLLKRSLMCDGVPINCFAVAIWYGMFVVWQALKSPRTPQLHAEKSVPLMPGSSSGVSSSAATSGSCCVVTFHWC